MAVLCAASSLPAATLYWDGADSTANPDGGAGTWDTATANWDDAATSGNAVVFTDGSDAVFGGTAGTVTVSSAITAGTVTFNTANYTITNTADISWAGLGGAGSFTKTGAGKLTITGNNNYSGSVSVTGGILELSGDHASSAAQWRPGAGGTINFASGSSVGASLVYLGYLGSNLTYLNVAGTVNNTGALTIGHRAAVTLNSGANWTQNGGMTVAIGNSGYAGTLTLNSGSLLTYTGTSTIYMTMGGSGSVSINMNGGTLVTGQGFVKSGTGTGTTTIGMKGGTLRLSGDIAQLTSVSGTGAGAFNFTLTGTGNTIDTNGFSTTLNRAVGGAGSLIKAGAGTLTRSGVNTYAGATTVNAGALAVSGTVLVNGANGVTVATGATLAVTGTLKLTSASASISVADADAFTASGTLDLGGLFDAYAGATYQLISSGAGKVAAGSTLTVTGYNNAANVATFDATTGSLVFTAVPEPSTYGLMGAGALATIAFMRRRQRFAR